LLIILLPHPKSASEFDPSHSLRSDKTNEGLNDSIVISLPSHKDNSNEISKLMAVCLRGAISWYDTNRCKANIIRKGAIT